MIMANNDGNGQRTLAPSSHAIAERPREFDMGNAVISAATTCGAIGARIAAARKPSEEGQSSPEHRLVPPRADPRISPNREPPTPIEP